MLIELIPNPSFPRWTPSQGSPAIPSAEITTSEERLQRFFPQHFCLSLAPSSLVEADHRLMARARILGQAMSRALGPRRQREPVQRRTLKTVASAWSGAYDRRIPLPHLPC